MHHTLSLTDGFKMQDKPGSSAIDIKKPVMKEYEVIAASGIFKNGKQYNKGEKILLTEKSAAGFLAAGDIKTI